MPKIRLNEIDQDKYERGDEWFVLDTSTTGIDALPQHIIEDIEEAIDSSILSWFTNLEKMQTKALRALAWAARRMAGIDEPFHEFWPHVLGIDVEVLPGEDAEGNVEPAPANRAERRAATTKSKARGAGTSGKTTGSTSAQRSTGTRGKSGSSPTASS